MTTSRIRSRQRRLAWLALPCSLMLAQAPAHATIGARVATGATSLQGFPGTPQLVIGGCTTSLDRGFASESTTASCGNINGPTSTQAALSAEATAPSGTGALTVLRASASADGSTNGPPGAHPYDNYQLFRASASAGFIDVIRHAGPVDHLALNFQLSGTLFVNNPSIDRTYAGSASVGVTMYAQSGTLGAGGSFGSFEPYSYGRTTALTRQVQGGVPATAVTTDPLGARDYAFQALPNGVFVVTLGPSFFANPANPDLYLDLGLSAVATLYAYANPNGPALSAFADYSHTFEMTGVTAFDAAGSDITGQAGLSFASSTLPVPVPEPGTWAMWVAGLALGAARLRRGSAG